MLPGKINYFRGNDEQKWITDVPTFRKVSYAAVYPESIWSITAKEGSWNTISSSHPG